MFRFLVLVALAAAISGCAAGRSPQLPASSATGSAAPESTSAAAAKTREFANMARQLHSPRLMAMVLLREAEAKKDPDRAVLAAMFAAQSGDYSLAAQAAGVARRIAPDKPEPYIAEVKIALDRGDVKQARRAIAEAFARGGADAVRVALSGPIDPWFSYAVVRPLALNHRNNSALAVIYAEAALEVGNAKSAYLVASSSTSRGPQTTVLVAQSLWDMGRRKEALLEAAKLVASQSHNVELRVFFAGLLIHHRDLDRAREELDDAHALAPDDPHVALGYAQLDVGEGHPAKARRLLTSQLEAGSDSAGIYNLLGDIAANSGQWGEAFGWYQNIDEGDFVSSAQVAAIFALANWQGDAQAEQYLDQLGRAFPALAPTWLGAHAALLQRSGKHRDAYELLVQASKRYPMVLDLRYQQAVVADQLGKGKTALRLFKGLLDGEPDNPEFLNAYGYTLTERTTRYHEAYGYIRRALAAEPDNGAFLDSMGWVLYRLGQSREALPYLRRAWRKTGDSDVAEHLITVCLALGRQAEASKVLDDALAKMPGNSELLKLKSQLTSPQPPH